MPALPDLVSEAVMKPYAIAERALNEAAKATERGNGKAARKWLAVAEEARLLGNDVRGHDVGFIRRRVD